MQPVWFYIGLWCNNKINRKTFLLRLLEAVLDGQMEFVAFCSINSLHMYSETLILRGTNH